eukprot:c20814_g1_i4 orf=218-427(-)
MYCELDSFQFLVFVIHYRLRELQSFSNIHLKHGYFGTSRHCSLSQYKDGDWMQCSNEKAHIIFIKQGMH